MTLRRLLLALVALVAGGVAAGLVLAARQAAPTARATLESAEILVATRPIGVGEELAPEKLAWQPWPKAALRADYIARSAEPDALATLAGTRARFEVFPGEPVLSSKLVSAGQGYLSAVLAGGMRAVSVEVSAVSASGGFILPNDRVDVLLTLKDGAASRTRTLVGNVRVLAIDRRLGETGTTGAAADPKDTMFQDHSVATLELDPEAATAVVNGARQGALSLVLRALVDFSPGGRALAETRSDDGSVRVIRFGDVRDALSATGAAAAASPAPAEVSAR